MTSREIANNMLEAGKAKVLADQRATTAEAQATTQRGYRSYSELTLGEVLKRAEEIAGEWDGDNSGRKEDRATTAMDMIEHLNEVLEQYKALEENEI